MRLSLRISLISIFTALGVVLSPFWIPVLTSKAFPAQHMINALAGVLLGPLDALIIAFLIGTIRISFSLGTIYAFPGGLPGGFVVGLFYMLFKRMFKRSTAMKISIWTEPIGTVLIGASLSLLVVAPLIGDMKMLELVSKNFFLGLLTLYLGWGISSFLGVILAFIIIVFIDRMKMVEKLE